MFFALVESLFGGGGTVIAVFLLTVGNLRLALST